VRQRTERSQARAIMDRFSSIQCRSMRRIHTRVSAKHKTAGFTLLELMVVILIMGLIVALVSVNMAPDERSRLSVETQRLAQLLDLAATEARMTGNSLAWTADAEAYRFQQLTAERGWVAVVNNDSLRPRQLPRGIIISALLIENSPAREAMRVEFPAYGQTTAFVVDMQAGEVRSQVRVSPIGMVEVVMLTEDDSNES